MIDKASRLWAVWYHIVYYLNLPNKPSFLRKRRLTIVFQEFKQPCMFETNIQTTIPCRARTRVTKCLLAFHSLCGAIAMVTERLLAYYRCFWMSAKLLESFPNSSRLLLSLQILNMSCKMCTSLEQSLLCSNEYSKMYTSLWQSLWSLNGG